MFIWTSLVVRWIRICLPTQRTQVLSLIWEDSMCHRAPKPLSHDYGAHAPPLLGFTHLEFAPHSKRGHLEDSPEHHHKEQLPFTATRGTPFAAGKTQHSQNQKLFQKFLHLTQKHIMLDDEILFTADPTQCEIPEGHMLGLILNK